MESTTHFRTQRGRANGAHHDNAGTGRRAHHKNKHWVADNATSRSSTPHGGADTERWERGGHRGSRGRGRGTRGKFSNTTMHFRQGGALDSGSAAASEGDNSEMEDATDVDEVEHQEPDTLEERERFWKELVKVREVERKTAIAEGKMDDPNVAKRLEDAITMVGTCMDMCPRFERYRRERENNLTEWEIVPGTKRVDHKRAVKMYERAAGDKTLPSDLRPPKVLRRTLDYLFHDLLPRGGFSATFNFIRDRSRAVRSDFTMQHEMGSIAIECHDRCARFHILGLHLERDRPGSQVSLEEQQLKYTLQSLKEFYEDQRGKYQSPTELEMRVYHRLIHIRDQKERHEDIPSLILEHPVFKLTTKFRLLVQAKSAPISRSSPLSVDNEALGVFNELIIHLFGTDTVDDIESLRENLTISDIIDGSSAVVDEHYDAIVEEPDAMHEEEEPPFEGNLVDAPQSSPKPPQRSGTEWLNDTFGPKPTESAFLNAYSQPAPQSPKSAFSNLTSVPNVFGATTFQTSALGSMNEFSFGSAAVPTSVFGPSATGTSIFSQAPSSGLWTTCQPPLFGQPLLVPPTTPTAPSENKVQVPVNKAASSIQPLNPHAPVFAPSLSPIITQPPPSHQPPVPPSPAAPQPTFGVPRDSFGSLDETPPSQPPPLSRQQPISLPPTPTAPLVLSSPGTRSTLSSMTNLHRRDSVQTPLRSGITAADLETISTKLESPLNGKASSSSPISNVDQETLKSKAFAFARRNLVIREAFHAWRERTANRTKWKEACLRSDAYSQRVHTERLSKSTSSLPQENKRKVVTPERPSPVRKRLRNRLSSEYRPPASDEELVKRFEKNREENERRWARGSFLHALQQHLKATSSTIPESWSAWLSLNQDNDGTAIWLELKFDIPDSGSWKDANVFQIPVVPQAHNRSLYPGIIIFERTPVGEVEDPLERKYRMLDDCSRLRDIIESLPPDRHFIPSILTISWPGGEPDSSSDFSDMIAAILHDEIAFSHVDLSLTSTASDLDSRFQSALQSVKVDTEGKLVRWMSVLDLFRQWKPIWQTFTSQRLEQCIVNGEFDWGFLGRFLELCIELLNTISSTALQLMGGNIFGDVLPNLKLQHVRDSDSMFDAVLQWLDNPSLQDPGRHLAGDLRSHQALDRVAQVLSTQRFSPKAVNPTLIRKTRFDAATLKISTEQGSYSDELNALHSAKLRQTCKRTASINASSSRSSTPAKRRRLSVSDESSDGGSPPLSIASPAYTSPSISTTTSLPPEDKSTVVTSAMLRALTREIRTKFGSPK
ncbi:SAC3/GANP/Nin1/mts3/eIF-3 p25 family-domain-containing protein [Suillus subaureus]|uniref:SAC3/GANP/Nin1/mts3/eIF-3 p25 family-domain-containing protein n=1 Tax=Suillus subaureus TaxID=48587 RepID=A0A9P7EKV0_9AGAM|nr:SAC3/GANP/Nin1/mts3/eIF-3 p25 family-domain-containing protein [Suillus subaureus]KAG1824658.1 SAC3/GANP/Nin1/mts3/eIF-3 p25 family-domain-containing protein [Suillus subaureus]